MSQVKLHYTYREVLTKTGLPLFVVIKPNRILEVELAEHVAANPDAVHKVENILSKSFFVGLTRIHD